MSKDLGLVEEALRPVDNHSILNISDFFECHKVNKESHHSIL